MTNRNWFLWSGSRSLKNLRTARMIAVRRFPPIQMEPIPYAIDAEVSGGFDGPIKKNAVVTPAKTRNGIVAKYNILGINGKRDNNLWRFGKSRKKCTSVGPR